MKYQGNIDTVKFARAADLGNLEFLHATFILHSFPRHTHETFAIGVIERGVQATYYGGSTHIATAGDICLVNPGEVHTGFSPHESGWTYRVFYPDASLLQRTAEAACVLGRRLPHFPSPIIKDQPLSQNILLFLKLLEESDVSLERESLLLSVLTQMIQRHADAGEGRAAYWKKKRCAVKTVLEYLDAHFTENVTLSELTDITDMSEFHLLRLFRGEVGLPPHAYLIQKRINYAKNLLSQRLTIAQTALEAGFTDQSHFTRRFKKIMGITPGQYCRNSNIVQERI
ncbi:MAG: AraC family transcriptional regulator [Proteobacteria bacterium]|nr:AraC family transcriptional regulator [Pseudomonadota bacterium]